MTEEILNIEENVIIDNTIESFQYIEKDTDQGTGSLNNQTELTFTFQQQDKWFCPSQSYLRIEGTLLTAADVDVNWQAAVAFANNGLMHLFSNAKYNLGSQQIEYFENAGVTTTIHNYLTKSRSYQGDSWFWLPDIINPEASATNLSWRTRNLIIKPIADGGVWNFSATIPLNAIFNFCSDYRKAIYGMQHRISLTRTTSTKALHRLNANVDAGNGFPALVALAEDAKVNITTFKWCMPYVEPSMNKLEDLLSIIKEKRPLDLTFLNKRSDVVPVPRATIFSWNIQSNGAIEKPRFLVLGFQTGRINQTSNSAAFDFTNLNVVSAYVTLGGFRYPYTELGTDYATNRYTKWYYNYKNFFNKYNSDNIGEACLSYVDFVRIAPLYVFDLSNQPERLKSGSTDVSLHMTFATAPPANTAIYAVQYFDSRYILTGDTNKQIIQVFNDDNNK